MTQRAFTRSLWTRASIAWIGLLALAFFNGALRELVLKKALGLGDLVAHQLSCLSGVFLWTSFTWGVWPRLGVRSFRESLQIGALWFVSTAVFETFVLNRGMSWAEILQTYDVLAGQFWGLALLWVGLMPAFVAELRRVTRR